MQLSRLNKRGQELSVNTLILIIIGVLVLVFLVVGFTIGWQKIFPFIKSGNNVKDVSDKCNLACNTQSQYDYCFTKREVTLDDKDSVAGLGNKFSGSCKELANVRQLGIGECTSIQCKNFVYSSKTFADLSCGGAINLQSPVAAPTDLNNIPDGTYAYAVPNNEVPTYFTCKTVVK